MLIKFLFHYLVDFVKNKINLRFFKRNKIDMSFDDLTKFDDLSNNILNEHPQWIMAISVGVLVSIYANGFCNVSLVVDVLNHQYPVNQFFHILSMTVFLLTILFMYGRFFRNIYPILVGAEKDGSDGGRRYGYTERKDTLKHYFEEVFGWPLFLRWILYVLYIESWFGIKYSIGYYSEYNMVLHGLECGFFGCKSGVLLFLSSLFAFILLLESPIIYSYHRIIGHYNGNE
jgi:hypothetical protein